MWNLWGLMDFTGKQVFMHGFVVKTVHNILGMK